MPNTNFLKRFLIIFLLAFSLSLPAKTEAYNLDLVANVISSAGNIYNDYIIDPISEIFISIFNMSDTPVEVSTATKPTTTTTTNTTPQNNTTTLPPNSGLQIRGNQGAVGPQGPKGDKGDTGPQGPRGPAGSSANIDTSNFVDSKFFDKQVDGILGSIEDGISGLTSSLGEEVTTALVTAEVLNVSGMSTLSGGAVIGSAITGTTKALVANNNTSTGNIFEAQDNGTTVFTVADGGKVGVGTGTPLTQFDVAPFTPVLEGTLTLTPNADTGSTMTMSVFGNYAYWMTRGDELLHIADVSNPAAMVEVSTLAISSSRNNGLFAYANNILYVGKATNAFDVVDVSNPKTPVLVKTMSSGCSGTTLTSYVRGNVLFNIGQNNSGACINAFDISDPVNPVLLSRISSINGTAVGYDGGRYMVVSQNASTTNLVIDVSNPANITQVSTFTSTWNSPNLSMKGRYIFACRIGVITPQMEVFDMKDPSNVISVNTFNLTTGYSCKEGDSIIAGNYLYMGNQCNSTNAPSLAVFDISNPTSPVLKATYVLPVTYVSGNTSGLRVFVVGRRAFLGWSNLQQNEYKLFAIDLGGVLVNQLEASTAQLGKLDVSGLTQFNDSVNIRGGLNVGRELKISGSFSAESLVISRTATATGALKGIVYTGAVNTSQTASTEIPSLTLTTAGRQWATGALTTQREVLITAPTYSFVGASTITNAATVGIAGAPVKSTNATITNTHALLIQAGAVSTATNSYGLTVNAQTGATNNYAAQFIGGNVGIGTAAPTDQLTMVNSTTGLGPIISMDATGNGGRNYRIMSGTTSNGSVGAGGFGIVDQGSGLTKFAINASGYVGIGTITPTTTHAGGLEISGTNSSLRMHNTANTGQALVEYADEGSVVRFTTGYNDNTSVYAMLAGSNLNATTGIMINTSGSVGIADTTPDALLDVHGTVCLDLNADDVCTDNTSALSDSRLKTNVVDMDNGLALLRQFRPVSFTWNGLNNTGDANSIGFLAQDIEALFPNTDLVITDTAGYKNLDYSKLTAVLTSAIQELDINLNAISGTIIPESGSATETFVTAFFDNIFTKVSTWLADAGNGIGDLFADSVYTKELCVTKSNGENFCVTGDQLEALVGSGGGGGSSPAPTPDPAPADSTCSDGIQNQDETGVDTGGVCTPAPEPMVEPTP